MQLAARARRSSRVRAGLARARAVVAVLAASVSLWGCRGTVATAPEDASSVSDEGATADAGRFSAPQGDDATAVDAAPCSVVVASDYDQSCAVDTDCVQVAEVPACPVSPMLCYSCPLATINGSAIARYRAAFSADMGGALPTACNCPEIGYPCCRSGLCKTSCFPAPADTLPTCADAGGSCAFPARFGCSGGAEGPADACAYSDEICCVN
jgi:hypothetical protein